MKDRCSNCEDLETLVQGLQVALDEVESAKSDLEKRYVNMKRRLVNQAATMERVYRPMLERIRLLEANIQKVEQNR